MASHAPSKARVCLQMASYGPAAHPMGTIAWSPQAAEVMDYNPLFGLLFDLCEAGDLFSFATFLAPGVPKDPPVASDLPSGPTFGFH